MKPQKRGSSHAPARKQAGGAKKQTSKRKFAHIPQYVQQKDKEKKEMLRNRKMAQMKQYRKALAEIEQHQQESRERDEQIRIKHGIEVPSADSAVTVTEEQQEVPASSQGKQKKAKGTQKSIPFAKEMKEFQKQKEQREKEIRTTKNSIAKKQKLETRKRKERKHVSGRLNERTKSGQPVMKHRLMSLVDRLQAEGGKQ